jgi:hypothetical protein
LQVDIILDELKTLVRLAQQAATAAGSPDDITSLNEVLSDAEKLRNETLKDSKTQMDTYLVLAKSIGVGIAAGLLALSLVGLLGAVLLVCPNPLW